MHVTQKKCTAGAATVVLMAIAGLVLSMLAGCDTTPGVPVTKITTWPYWRDVQTDSKDYDAMWRTSVDVLSENYPVEVLDKDAGYLKTEWKVYTVPNSSTDTGVENDAFRYSVKVFPVTGVIRLGVEIKNNDTGAFYGTIKGDTSTFNQFVWKGIPEQLQARLKGGSAAKPQ